MLLVRRDKYAHNISPMATDTPFADDVELSMKL